MNEALLTRTVAEEHDTTTPYASTDGEELSFARVAMATRRSPNVTAEDHPEGCLVDGVVFSPVAGDENHPR